jgi:sugar/nucleoside kinase (ribokinase family)
VGGIVVQYVTVGNLTIDEIRLPDGRMESRQCGGNCLYAAVGARIWADSVGIVSLAGNDFPAEWLERVREAGIHTTGIAPLPRPHGMSAGLAYDSTGARTFVDEEIPGRGEFERHPHEWEDWLAHSPSIEQFPQAYEEAVGIHFAPMPVQAHEPFVERVRNPGRTVTLDSPWWDGASGALVPYTTLLKNVDALLPSEAEVQVFYESKLAPTDAVRTLAHLGPDIVVVKVGAGGCLVYSSETDTITHIPAYPALALDPTGAGDAFCGGFLVGLVETGDPVEAARFGTVSASFVVEGFSSLYALDVTRAAAEERLLSLTPRRA